MLLSPSLKDVRRLMEYVCVCRTRTRNIQIWAVNIFPGRLPFALTLLRPVQPSAPRFVHPREEDELEFSDYVGVGHVEMVFEIRGREHSPELRM
jgi:hypothetical protein